MTQDNHVQVREKGQRVSSGLRFCGPHRRKQAKIVYGPMREVRSAFI